MRVREAGQTDRVLELVTSKDIAFVVPADMGEAYTTTESDVEMTISYTATSAVEGAAPAQRYDDYARYGMSYDQAGDALYYQGSRVRVFTDGYPLGDNTYACVEHVDPAGTIDVEAIRDVTAITYNPDGSYDPSGTLTGLSVSSTAAFAARDVEAMTMTNAQVAMADSAGGPMTRAEKVAFYAAYADLGISYDAQTDQVRYQGQIVHSLLDVQRTNGEALASGLFAGSMTQITEDYGDIDVTIQRDYSRPDAQGNGTIIGIIAQPVK